MAEVVRMPMVGKIISVDVKVGQVVAEGDTLGVFESMKMEMPLMAPVGGTVQSLEAAPGKVMETDAPFCTIE